MNEKPSWTEIKKTGQKKTKSTKNIKLFKNFNNWNKAYKILISYENLIN